MSITCLWSGPGISRSTDCDVHVFKWIWNHYSVIHRNETCTSVGFLCVQFVLSFSAQVKGNKVRHVRAVILVVGFWGFTLHLAKLMTINLEIKTE